MKSTLIGRIPVLVGLALSLALLVVFGVTAKAQIAPDPVMVGAGDIGNCRGQGDEATAALLDGIEGTVFTVGDNAYPDGTSADFANCYEPSWGRHKARTMPSLGNHEYMTPGASGYFDYFGAAAGEPAKGYYSYDLGDWHIVVLNANCSVAAGGCSVGSPQEQWLKNDLAANSSACTLAYWHQPRFASGVHGNDPSVGPFWNDLYQAGADVVLNGHDHSYERFAPQNPSAQADPSQGIREFVVGTGGAAFTAFPSIQPNSETRIANTNGVLKLTLHPEGYDWAFVTAPGGAVADSGSGQCHGAPPPAPVDTAPPTVQPPQQDLPTNATLGTSAIPTKLSWSATDEGSGVASYELQQSVDGGASFTSVTLPSATSTSKTFQLQPAGTYQFRVRAIDGAGNTSDWVSGPAFSVDPQQENSAAILYAGSWTQQALTAAYGGGVRYASAKGSVAQFTFTGQNVAWVTTKGPNRGKATVSVDGVVVKTLDLYASTTQPRKVVFSQPSLDPAVSHTITVQVSGAKRAASSGTRVDIDAFVALR